MRQFAQKEDNIERRDQINKTKQWTDEGLRRLITQFIC